MLAPYRALLQVPHLGSILVLSVLGRVHALGVPLALTFLVAEWTGSYALAGLVLAGLTVGNGISGPWRGRLADRRSAPRLLTTTCLLWAAGMAIMLSLPAWAWPVAPVLALLTGLSTPPVGQVSRAAYTRLATGEARSAVFAAEATLFELAVMSGPLLAALAVGLGGPRLALGLIAAVGVITVLAFAAALRRAGLGAPAPVTAEAATAGGTVLTVPGLLPALAVAMLLAMGFTSANLGVVALGRDLGQPALAGVLVAVWAIGSMVGGLIAGGLKGRPRYVRRVALLAVGVAVQVPVLPPLAAPSPLLFGVLLALGGMAIAPAIAASNQRLGELAPQGRTAEVFGWLASATTTGAAAAAPLAGWLLDRIGPAASAGAATLVAVLATGFAVLSSRRQP